jgi:exopolysaccharide biosynthesis polyprenyl glycosylphosphotransferase
VLRSTADSAESGSKAAPPRRALGVPLGLPAVRSSSRLPADAILRRALALADFAAVMLGATTLAVLVDRADQAFWAATFAPVWLVLARLHGLYHRDQRALRHLTVDELPALVFWSLTGTAATALLLMVTPAGSLEAPGAIRTAATVAVSAFVLRALARTAWRRITPPERTLIVGDGPLAAATRRKLELFSDIHVVVSDQRREPSVRDLDDGSGRAPTIDRIIVASQSIDEATIAELVRFCTARGIKLSVVPPLRGMFGTAVELSHVSDLPVLQYNTWGVPRSTLALKRALDIIGSTVGVVVTAPFMLAVAIAIFVESGRPIFFVQERAGRGGRAFRMYKFRTMDVDAERRLADVVDLETLPEPVFKLPSDPRVTRIGRLLRRTSIDELPQLLNVLRGDMSLVGPRPEQVDLVERYTDEQRVRLAVKPGLTGPMQVYGRGSLTLAERLAVEREYVENLSMSRDLRLLAMTVPVVRSGKGAY